MAYYSILGFKKEPFSTSPDPAFFYLTKEHDMALTNILIELHLKRGLSVIFGDVGTGKTSLSRTLVQDLKKKGGMIFHVILNPVFNDERQFFKSLLNNFDVDGQFTPESPNPDIIELAILIGRSSSSVAWKLANFARLDPVIQARGLSGASHGSKGEIEVWNAFNENWDELSYESEILLKKLQKEKSYSGTENMMIVKKKEKREKLRLRQE